MNEYFDNIVYDIDKINGIANQRDGITYEFTYFKLPIMYRTSINSIIFELAELVISCYLHLHSLYT